MKPASPPKYIESSIIIAVTGLNAGMTANTSLPTIESTHIIAITISWRALFSFFSNERISAASANTTMISERYA